jgi:lysophospholipase L1-like esterase
MKHVLCYGDSNTWGFEPVTGLRYDEHTRWTGRLNDILGSQWRIHEEGLNARTSIFDDPFKPFLNGRNMLSGILTSQKPLDAVVLSLGTNDLKFVDAWHAAQGIGQLIDLIRSHDLMYPSSVPVFEKEPKIIVVSPIEVDAELAQREIYSTLKFANEQSRLFAKEYSAVCAQRGVIMVDAAKVAMPSKRDCIHMDPDGHEALAQAVAKALKETMGE